MQTNKTAAIVGGGVIGGGWAARFLLSGWHVRIFDPDSSSRSAVTGALERARRFYPALYDFMLPPEGRLEIASDIRSAVFDAAWIQESVPERLTIKQEVFAEIQKFSPPGGVIASSTSGFKPSQLQEGALRPEQLIVAHPFNPVYLLPIVELVLSPANSESIKEQAAKILQSIGMKPLHVRSEIEAHIGDRLLEALWREALWLVHDDIATTQEIDEVITHGFGLRWAQMGLFETYRIAGGAAGMAHFIEQFGPYLGFPWSKLIDTPEMSSAFAAKIGDQSDKQSGHLSIEQLEQIRDNNIVTILRGLKARNWGAGKFLREHDQTLPRPSQPITAAQSVTTAERVIPPDWIDYNGHMNEARYLEIFSLATDELLALAGCDQNYVESGKSFFTLETHLRHIAEAYAGDTVRVRTNCLFFRGKKLHLLHILERTDGAELASAEHLLLHIDLEQRRSSDPEGSVAEVLSQIHEAHKTSVLPGWISPKLRFS